MFGRVGFEIGGVAFNFAKALIDLGDQQFLVTVYGSDGLGQGVYNEAIRHGINMEFSKEVIGAQTSTYLCITDECNNDRISLCDRGILHTLKECDLDRILSRFDTEDYYVVDNNLSKLQLSYLLKQNNDCILLPISEKSLDEVLELLPKFKLVHLTRYNIEKTFDLKIYDEDSLHYAIDFLIGMGIKRCILLLDDLGVVLIEETKYVHFWHERCKSVVNKKTHELFLAAYLEMRKDHVPCVNAVEFALGAVLTKTEYANEVAKPLTRSLIIEKIAEYGIEKVEDKING